MTRKTKALSGASQDAYFRKVLQTFPGLTDAAREDIVRRLRQEVAQLRVRAEARDATFADPRDADAQFTADLEPTTLADASEAPSDLQPDRCPPAADPFDPFALNVIVTLRTKGRAAALDALQAVGNAEHLKLLAREQRLSIDHALATSAELSSAIVSAAERRLANRRAAATI